ncbi:hypothetical protein D3C73_420990 [compost metagenome]
MRRSWPARSAAAAVSWRSAKTCTPMRGIDTSSEAGPASERVEKEGAASTGVMAVATTGGAASTGAADATGKGPPLIAVSVSASSRPTGS